MSRRKKIWHYLKSYRFNSLLIRNFLIILSLLAIPVIVLSQAYYSYVRSSNEEYLQTYNSNELYKFKQSADSLLSNVQRTAISLSFQEAVQLAISSDSYETLFEDVDEQILELTNLYVMAYQFLDSCYIYLQNKDAVIYKGSATETAEFADMTWRSAYHPEESTVQFTARLKNDFYPWILTAVLPLEINSNRGAVVVNVKMDELDNFIGGMENSTQQRIYVVDETGVILYSTQQDLINTEANKQEFFRQLIRTEENSGMVVTVEGQEYIASRLSSEVEEWQYISLTPLALYEQETSRNVQWVLLVIVLTVLVGLLMSVFISAQSYKPLSNIMEVIEDAQTRVPQDVTPEGKYANELDYIIRNITRTTESLEEQKTELDRRLFLLERAQMQALQSQMNPHFLYNTLETINWMAARMSSGDNDVSKSLRMLAKLFRSFNSGEGFLITIEEEVRYAKLYVDLLKLRHGDDLTVTWDIEEGILPYKTIKFLLQTLIENAVIHGLNPAGGIGAIDIAGRRVGDHIHFRVRDNGVGISLEQARRVNKMLARDYNIPSGHVGLANINQRIKFIYGENCGVSIGPCEGGGTEVLVNITASL